MAVLSSFYLILVLLLVFCFSFGSFIYSRYLTKAVYLFRLEFRIAKGSQVFTMMRDLLQKKDSIVLGDLKVNGIKKKNDCKVTLTYYSDEPDSHLLLRQLQQEKSVKYLHVEKIRKKGSADREFFERQESTRSIHSKTTEWTSKRYKSMIG